MCENFFNTIDHMDYHPSKHVTPNLKPSKSINHCRTGKRACSSCKARQCFDLSTDEMKYLPKLKVALMNVYWKLCHNIIKTPHRVTSKGLKDIPTPTVGDPTLDKNDLVF